MLVKYTPQGQETQQFEWRPGRVKLKEAAQIEFRYSKESGEKGRTYEQFKQDVRVGSAVARRVLLHHLLRRVHPAIRFEDVDPFDDEVVVVFHRDELEELRVGMGKDTSMSAEEKANLLERLDQEIDEAPEYGQPGKADATSTTDPDQ